MVHRFASSRALTGRFAEAVPLYQRALTTRERVLGAEHPDTFESVENLAVLRLVLGGPDTIAAAVDDLDPALEAWARRVGQELRAGAGEGLRSNLAGISSLRDITTTAALSFPDHVSLGARALLITKGIAGETDAALSRLVAGDPRPEVREATDALQCCGFAIRQLPD